MDNPQTIISTLECDDELHRWLLTLPMIKDDEARERQKCILETLIYKIRSGQRMVDLIDNAKLENISRGVELGAMSWHMKMLDAINVWKEAEKHES